MSEILDLTKPEVRDEQQAICDAATPGEWRAELQFGMITTGPAFTSKERIALTLPNGGNEADLCFAAAARAGYPAALKLIGEQQKMLDELREELSDAYTWREGLDKTIRKQAAEIDMLSAMIRSNDWAYHTLELEYDRLRERTAEAVKAAEDKL